MEVYPLCFYLCQMKYLFFVQKNNKSQEMCFLEQSDNRTQEREKRHTEFPSVQY